MRLTERQLNRATLARRLLLRRERTTVAEAVRRTVAPQAQEPASPYVALWNRVADLDPADLDAAFAAHEVVKATLVAGVWRATGDGIEATAFRPLRAADRAGPAEEAAALARFLAPREPLVHGRHRHWGAKLPPGDTRILAG